MYGIVITGLVLVAVVLFILWRNAVKDEREAKKWQKYYEAERRALDSQIRDVGMLIVKKWTPIKTNTSLVELWEFKAPDEKEPRKFNDAVTRQRKLDEIAKYNLPKEYEVMDDSKIPT